MYIIPITFWDFTEQNPIWILAAKGVMNWTARIDVTAFLGMWKGLPQEYTVQNQKVLLTTTNIWFCF